MPLKRKPRAVLKAIAAEEERKAYGLCSMDHAWILISTTLFPKDRDLGASSSVHTCTCDNDT